jgi:cytidine deaminase
MDSVLRDRLRSNLERCLVKEGDVRTSSIAISASGAQYDGVVIGSDTNLLTISSEQAALSMATAVWDYEVEHVITMVGTVPVSSVNPLVLKILVDHAIRTHRTIAYTLMNESGKIFFALDDARKAIPFYVPETIALTKIGTAVMTSNVVSVYIDDRDALKRCAIMGIERNFPLYDSASGYGAAVMTHEGRMYYSGQYSSPDKRLNVHAEMNAVLSAVMAGEKDIVRLGVVSSKFTDTPCHMCGCCRQFFSEMCAKLKWKPSIHCFAKDTDDQNDWTIDTYLPSVWTSKKW